MTKPYRFNGDEIYDDFDNLPHTLMSLQFIGCDIKRKIHFFPESLIDLLLYHYGHDIDNLPVGLRYFACKGLYRSVSNIPPNLVYFNSLKTTQEFNILSPFPEGLKYFGFNGDYVDLEYVNKLPDSVTEMAINDGELSELKYPKSLKTLRFGEYACIDLLKAIPEGVEYFQLHKRHLKSIIPELLPKTLKTFKIIDYGNTDFETDDENEDTMEDINERSRKKARFETKEDILSEYLIKNGVNIIYNNDDDNDDEIDDNDDNDDD